MTNKENLKKSIMYRSTHRGSKEMDILLGQFVKKHISGLSVADLEDLNEIMIQDDDLLYDWYFNNISNEKIPSNKITEKLRKFKL
tara:strand:- start:45 stop:299 length:255 start_codon:yes stop_codon:yes gene_type:complete